MLKDFINDVKNQPLWYEMPLGVLSIKGVDAKDFLQRMSTNDLSNLSEKKSLCTAFINSKGRMVDFVHVFAKNSDEFLLVSSHTDAQILAEWLEKFHFIEDFSITINQEFSCFYVLGPVLASKNAQILDTGFSIEGIGSFSLLLDKIAPSGKNMSFEIFDTLRVAALMPLAPSEINDCFMPQNINLQSFIAQKGCYIGQEVILKALTYQKQAKKLLGVKLSQDQWTKKAIEEGELLSIAPIYQEGLINALVISKGL